MNDIPKTLCLNLTLTENCDFFNGINLLETNSIGDTPYYVFISRNEKPNCCAIKNFDLVKVPSRKINFVDALKNKDYVLDK